MRGQIGEVGLRGEAMGGTTEIGWGKEWGHRGGWG